MDKNFSTVYVAAITEYPTALGSSCKMLNKLNLSPYWQSEEEIFEAITLSADNKSDFSVCKDSSHCSLFWEEFSKGITPCIDKDPITLLEYGGQYWVAEGKHRVCMAKRMGVKTIQAQIHPLKCDDYSLLATLGNPGTFSFSYTRNKPDGEVAALWVSVPRHCGIITGGFEYAPVFLDHNCNTDGEWCQVMPGVRYRVDVKRHFKWLISKGLISKKMIPTVSSEIEISPEHPNTKIWLMSSSWDRISGNPSVDSMNTVYRWGMWREHHKRLAVVSVPNTRLPPII